MWGFPSFPSQRTVTESHSNGEANMPHESPAEHPPTVSRFESSFAARRILRNGHRWAAPWRWSWRWVEKLDPQRVGDEAPKKDFHEFMIIIFMIWTMTITNELQNQKNGCNVWTSMNMWYIPYIPLKWLPFLMSMTLHLLFVLFFWPRLSYAVLSSVTAPENRISYWDRSIQMGYRWLHKWHFLQIGQCLVLIKNLWFFNRGKKNQKRALKCKVFQWEQASLHCTCLVIFEIFRITIHHSFPDKAKDLYHLWPSTSSSHLKRLFRGRLRKCWSIVELQVSRITPLWAP